MNIFEFTSSSDDKDVLVNFDNVCEVRRGINGSKIYFNTKDSYNQSELHVKESLEEIKEKIIR